MLLRFVFATIFLVTACEGDPTPGLTLEGTWQLRSSPSQQLCAGRTTSFPFAPQQVELAATDTELEITTADRGEVRYQRTWSDPGQVWQRHEARSLDGCDVNVTSRWRLLASSANSLSAVYEIEATADGVDCAHRERCRIQHVVRGIRR